VKHSAPLVLVSVGTDHHRFDRLVAWVDGWARQHADEVQVVVQHGESVAPCYAEGHRFLDHEVLQDLMTRASVVVSHGGPATILEARRHGHRPLVVARDPRHGEHVDDHQQRFVARVAAEGMVVQARDEAGLVASLDTALGEPKTIRLDTVNGSGPAPDAAAAAAVARVGEQIAAVLATAGRDRRRVRVLYLGGLGRSGSTLLERTLGQLDGVVGIGEAVHLWERGLAADEPCGCGQPFSRCPFWVEVGRVAYGGWSQVDLPAVLAAKAGVDRTRYAPALAAGALAPVVAARARRYRALLGRLYTAVGEVSGARLVVDSSKHASYAYLLRGVPEVDLEVLHVVRDAPAVAYAWAKETPREPGAAEAMMTRWSPLQTALQWDAQNGLVSALAALGTRVHRVRYEDFVTAPAVTVTALAERLGRPVPAPVAGYLRDGVVDLRTSHTVSGNPSRLRTGPTEIRPDEAWRTGLTARDRRRVCLATAPLRAAYGYAART